MSDQLWMNDWLRFERNRKRVWRERVIRVRDWIVVGVIALAVSGVMAFTFYGFWLGL